MTPLQMIVMISCTGSFDLNRRLDHQKVMSCCNTCRIILWVKIINLVTQSDVVGLCLLTNIMITFEEGLILSYMLRDWHS